MSTHRPNLIERAFALAASGDYATVTEIRMALRKEGYDAVEPQLVGPQVRKQLRRLMEQARATGGDDAA